MWDTHSRYGILLCFPDYLIGRDAQEEPLQTVDTEPDGEGNSRSSEFPRLSLYTFLISSSTQMPIDSRLSLNNIKP